MRTAVALLMLFALGPAWAHLAWAQGPAPRDNAQLQLAASVISAALTFIAPRVLEPVSVQQLALWGLDAPGSLDGGLSTEVRDGRVMLLQDHRPVFSSPLPTGADPQDWGNLVAAVLQAAVDNSVAVHDAGMQGSLTAFFDEMFNHLDPYSRYVAPQAADVDRARRSGEAGAGIELRQRGRSFVVTDVNADGPAAEGGVAIGDRVIAIDDRATAGESLETVADWIGGLEGTDLSITFQTGRHAPRTVDMQRVVIPPETVFASRLGPWLLLRVTSFSEDTDDRMARELTGRLDGAAGRGVRGIVLDLRGNRGGLLRQSVAAVNLLMDSGVIATTKGRNPQADHVWRATPGDLTDGRPMVVLVDGRSASAAEIMAAALGDAGRAVLVGSATLGKGLVQTILKLPDGGELFVSWSRVLAPGGWPMQGLGVMPQVCTSRGQAMTDQELDELEHGGQPMAQALARHHAARAPLPLAEALALRTPCPAAVARDADLVAAKFLLGHPKAYSTALLSQP